jgi:uncharacterized membrane protein YccC
MSIAVLEEGTTTELRFYRLGVPWPAGTTNLALQIWVALAVTYYVAFVLELNAASSVGTGIFILVGPTQGMVLSKAIYRLAATLFGAAVAIVLTGVFSQDRTMLIASFRFTWDASSQPERSCAISARTDAS